MSLWQKKRIIKCKILYASSNEHNIITLYREASRQIFTCIKPAVVFFYVAAIFKSDNIASIKVAGAHSRRLFLETRNQGTTVGLGLIASGRVIIGHRRRWHL